MIQWKVPTNQYKEYRNHIMERLNASSIRALKNRRYKCTRSTNSIGSFIRVFLMRCSTWKLMLENQLIRVRMKHWRRTDWWNLISSSETGILKKVFVFTCDRHFWCNLSVLLLRILLGTQFNSFQKCSLCCDSFKVPCMLQVVRLDKYLPKQQC